MQKRGATLADVVEARVQARADYLLEMDANSKQIIKDLGKEKGTKYVVAIAQCWYESSLESRTKILELAKDLASEQGADPANAYKELGKLVQRRLADKPLLTALTRVLELNVAGEDYKSVQLEQ
jgi:hypothetical protein